jgi:hypothetical protein
VVATDFRHRNFFEPQSGSAGKRFVAHAEEKLTAFLELESTIRVAERAEDCGGREIEFDKLSRIK